jgi:hypothetical protein
MLVKVPVSKRTRSGVLSIALAEHSLGVSRVRGLTRQHVQIGVTLRLLRDYLTVPAGTVATVETINSGRNWHFTVRWKSHTPTARPWRSQQVHRLMPMERSLNLSEEDLQSFELATDQDLLSPHPPSEIPVPDGGNGQDEQQLGIPFRED